MNQSSADLVAQAKSRIRNLSPDEVASAIGEEGTVVVDIREADEREATGALPGAIHAPRGMLEFYADPAHPSHKPELAPDREIILVCASGGRSALAADTLQTMGFRHVAHLDGGMNAWLAAGKPVNSA